MNTKRVILSRGIALLAASSIQAAVFTWDGGSLVDSNINTQPNWVGDVGPLPADDVVFTGSARTSVNVPGAFFTQSITFNNLASAFTFGGPGSITVGAGGIINNDADTMTFNNQMAFSAGAAINTASGGLVFGGTLNIGANNITLLGGNALTLSMISGTGAFTKNGTGTLTINPTGPAIGADFTINNGTMLLAASGSSQTFSGSSTIAIGASGTLTINQNMVLDGGAQLTRANGAIFGIAAGKTLTVQGGSDFISSAANTLSFAGGNITVSGSGSTSQLTGSANVYAGSSLTIQSGGAFTAGLYTDIGTAGTGTVLVDGAGSSFTTGSLSFWGSGGTANVTFSNSAAGNIGGIDAARAAGSVAVIQVNTGADVTTSGNLLLGSTTGAGSNGTLTVDGAGSTWTQSGIATNTIGATFGSTAAVNVQNSGVFTTGTGLTTVNATGGINLTSGGSLVANGDLTLNGTGALLQRDSTSSLVIGTGKAFTIQNGADATLTGSYVGANGAFYNVTGAGSSLTLGDGGFGGQFDNSASVSVSSGGTLSNLGVLEIGTTGGTGGSVTVDGTGSTLTSGSMRLGGSGAAGGTGSLVLSNSASATLSALGVAASNVTGSSGTVLVQSGADLIVGGQFTAGFSGSGAVTGTITVTGAGSTLANNAGNATIGTNFGTGVLNVNNGGVFASTTGTTEVGALGTVSINGGTFTANGDLNINGGQLTLDGAGTLSLASGKFLNVQGGGDVNITGPFSQTVQSNLYMNGAGSTFATTGDINWNGETGLLASGLSVLNGSTLASGGALNLGTNTTLPVSLQIVGVGATVSTSATSTSEWNANVSMFSSSSAVIGHLRLADRSSGTPTNGSMSLQNFATASLGNLSVSTQSSAANNGTITVSGAGSQITQTGSSTLTLGAFSGSGTAVLNLNNGGAFTTGTGSVAFRSTSTVNINGGALTVNGLLENSFGGWMSGIGDFNFNSGTLNLNGGNTLRVGEQGLLGADLTLAANRALNVGGSVVVDPFHTLILDGGRLSAGLIGNEGTLDFRRGTLAITGGGGFTIGSGALDALGANVTLGVGSTLQVTNTLTVASGAQLATDGGSVSVGALSNSGFVEHGSGSLSVSGLATNAAGADFFLGRALTATGGFTNQSGARLTLQGGTGRINGGALANSGMVTGDGIIAVSTTNSGTCVVRAELGKTLSFTGASNTNSGSFNMQGGTLEFSNTHANGATGFISGRGALNTTGLTNNGVMAFSGGVTDIRGDVTNASGARIVTSGAGSTTTFFDDVVHNGTEIYTGAGASTVFFGSQSGAGAFTGTGTVYYNGDLRPGNSPATVNYGGNVVLAPGTELTLEIGGVSEGTQYDSLQVANALTVDGILTLMLINGFAPTLGNVFDLIDAASINGTFDAVNLPTLAQYLAWSTSNLYTTGEVSVNSTLTPIQQWRLQNFSDPSNAGDGADNNDFDKDGIANLMEYALGMDPRIPSAAGLPTLGVVTVGANQHAALTVVRPLGATDVNYRFEVTADLLGFDAGSVYGPVGDVPSNAFTTEVSRTNNGSVETIVVRDNTPLSGSAKRFLRLKVTNPAP